MSGFFRLSAQVMLIDAQRQIRPGDQAARGPESPNMFVTKKFCENVPTSTKELHVYLPKHGVWDEWSRGNLGSSCWS